MKSNPSPSDSLTVISSLAHELDSPLKSVLSKTRKLIDDYKNRDFEFISYKDFNLILNTLKLLERQLEHCSQTTSRMLYVGKRKVQLEKNNCQINDVIKGVANDLSHQFKLAQVKLSMRLDKKLPLSKLGPVECHQIIHNVILNAMQSMHSGGTIKIKTSLNIPKKMIAIDVTDQGVGISPEHLERVFEPFFTTKERGIDKSSGLGLSIIHSIINAVGGSIHIKSSLRQGTSVQIFLPVNVSK